MKTLLYFLVAAFLISSCASSHHVNNNLLLQKRKFNKGWHWSGGRANKSTGGAKENAPRLAKKQTKETENSERVSAAVDVHKNHVEKEEKTPFSGAMPRDSPHDVVELTTWIDDDEEEQEDTVESDTLSTKAGIGIGIGLVVVGAAINYAASTAVLSSIGLGLAAIGIIVLLVFLNKKKKSQPEVVRERKEIPLERTFLVIGWLLILVSPLGFYLGGELILLAVVFLVLGLSYVVTGVKLKKDRSEGEVSEGRLKKLRRYFLISFLILALALLVLFLLFAVLL